jgi:hypothetical protein
LEVGSGSTTLYVEGGKVGINTETPNEELTIVGSISASENIFAVDGTLTGAFTVDGASTLNGAVTVNNTFNTTGAASLGSSLTVTTNISGSAGSSAIFDFIIDGGQF